MKGHSGWLRGGDSGWGVVAVVADGSGSNLSGMKRQKAGAALHHWMWLC